MEEDQRAYRITLLGCTYDYVVVHVILRERLAQDTAMQHAHNAELTRYVTQARVARRKLWMATDSSCLTVEQTMRLFYRTVLPFIHLPIISRGFGQIPSLGSASQRDAQTACRLLSARFQHQVVPDLAAALPPDLVATSISRS
jgi:hypothetical protein